MSDFNPPIALELPENEAHVKYILEEASKPDYDFPEVSKLATKSSYKLWLSSVYLYYPLILLWIVSAAFFYSCIMIHYCLSLYMSQQSLIEKCSTCIW